MIIVIMTTLHGSFSYLVGWMDKNIDELCRNSGKSIQCWNVQDGLKGKYNVCYAKSNILFFI